MRRGGATRVSVLRQMEDEYGLFVATFAAPCNIRTSVARSRSLALSLWRRRQRHVAPATPRLDESVSDRSRLVSIVRETNEPDLGVFCWVDIFNNSQTQHRGQIWVTESTSGTPFRTKMSPATFLLKSLQSGTTKKHFRSP